MFACPRRRPILSRTVDGFWGHGSDRGQVTIASAGVLVILLAAVGGLTLIGRAMIERETATAAADAVALALATDSAAGRELADWYSQRGIATYTTGSGQPVQASIGQGRAESLAIGQDTLSNAPAVIAVVERARQLTQHRLSSARPDGVTVSFDAADAAEFDSVASLLAMCEIAAPTSGDRTWLLC